MSVGSYHFQDINQYSLGVNVPCSRAQHSAAAGFTYFMQKAGFYMHVIIVKLYDFCVECKLLVLYVRTKEILFE